MNKKKSYDAFISYRRDGGIDFARSVAYCLRYEGLQCFFDQEELKTGQFNEQIHDAIENSRYFLSVITPGSLDRCVNEDDWVRKEILEAIEWGKTIIPVAVLGERLEFPDNLPPEMDVLKTAQASFIDRQSHFERTIADMLRDQMPDLLGRTERQRRKSRRQAEKVFIKKARRFKGNDGVIDADERTELERLASACGIGRNRLEELIEDVELAAARRAKAIAWIKSHRLLSTSVLLAVAAGVVLPLWMLLSTASRSSGDSASTRATGSAKSICTGSESSSTPSKPEMDFAREKLKKLDYDIRNVAERDLLSAAEKVNAHRRASPPRSEMDLDLSKVKWVETEYEAISGEVSRLLKIGMGSYEIPKLRPDLHLRMAEIRLRYVNETKSLVASGRHEDALKYYNLIRAKFNRLGMEHPRRPDLDGK